ncbi:MAG TPA: DUF296 domain-containing protein [Gammaproteobacteria bacterium]|nr:DUF296 domain-containing protein [Gammaproteobacteria bacterium]
MNPGSRNSSVLLSLAAAAVSLSWAAAAHAQQQVLPEGYIRPGPVQTGHAPKMKVESAPSTRAHVYQVDFGAGDEILSGLTELAEREHITSAYITGLGGLSTGMLGWGDPSNGAFKKVPIDKKCELVSLVGNISLRNGKPYVHLHGVVAFSDGSTKGGHVLEAHVAPIAEITVVATSAEAD